METARRPAAPNAGRLLLLLTAGWQLSAGFVTLVVGVLLDSTALTGAGAASLIDGMAEVVRLSEEHQVRVRSPLARALHRWLPTQLRSVCLLTAAYLLLAGAVALATGQPATRHLVGLLLMALSMTVLAVLMEERRHHALHTAGTCPQTAGISNRLAYLALAVFFVLLAHALLGWWWADPLAGIIIAGLVVRVGVVHVGYDAGRRRERAH